MFSQALKSNCSVSLCITITDDHVNVFANAFCTQSSLCKACCHGEELYKAVILTSKDRSHFCVLDIYVVDNDVTELAVSQFHDLVVHSNCICCIQVEVFVS